MKPLLVLAFALFSTLSVNGQTIQTFVNKLWEQQTGEPDTVDWSATVYNGNDGGTFVVGNTMNGVNVNALVTKLGPDGFIEWSDEYAGTDSLADYGTGGAYDGINDLLYVCGVTKTAANGYDYLVRAYDAGTGSLQWSVTINGSGSADDVATNIGVDEYGDVYITGTSQQSLIDYDFWTVKYNSSGVFQWNQYYDYDGFADAAGTLLIGDGYVTVGGMIGTGPNDGDIYVRRYDYTGQFVDDYGTNYGWTKEMLTGMTRDLDGNYYLVGQINASGFDDIYVAKLNNQMDLIWNEFFDNPGYDDRGNDIEVDAYGNIYVAGSLEQNGDVLTGILIKYNSVGTLQWHRIINAKIKTNNCETMKLVVNSNITLASFVEFGADYGVDLVTFDPDGKPLWGHSYNPSNNDDERPVSLKIGTDSILYLVCRTSGTESKYTIAAFATKEVQNFAAADTSFGGSYLSGQLIVRFNPDIVNVNFINNLDRQYASLDDVIPDSVITAMSTVTGYDFSKDVTALKIFLKITLADSISTARSGTPIRMPKLWSAFTITVPEQWNMHLLLDSLTTLGKHVMYTHPNYILETADVPNDPFVTTEQESLIPTLSWPNGHINMEPAWAIEHGQTTVKVGVLDEPVFWDHPDFGGGTGNISDSKVEGWNYNNNSDISNITSPDDSHGTACAGIIGALRNNNMGIAGIAGGDVDSGGNTGCRLYSLYCAYASSMAAAILDGAAETTNNGYGLDIISCSAGFKVDPDIIGVLADAVHTAWRNECLFVAARGNYGSQLDGNPPFIPACFNDRWIMNIVAGGNDGEHLNEFNGGDDPTTWESSYGNGVDVSAPGSPYLVSTTINPTEPSGYNNCTAPSEYQCFGGTSAATPHVSGLAALMMSHHTFANGYGAGIAPEDAEFLIQRYADDKGAPGYDDFNGHGLINAGATMAVINQPHYRVYHSEASTPTTLYSYLYNQTVFFTHLVVSEYPFSTPIFLQPGMYNAYRVQRTDVYNLTFGPTTEIINYWPRYASSTGLNGLNVTDGGVDPLYSWDINGNTATVTTVSFSWHVTSDLNGSPLDVWIPNEKQNTNADFSLHLYDPAATNVNELDASLTLSLHPNPAHDVLNLTVTTPTAQPAQIEIMDISGRIVMESELHGAKHYVEAINLSNISEGMYFCKISMDGHFISKKFVIFK